MLITEKRMGTFLESDKFILKSAFKEEECLEIDKPAGWLQDTGRQGKRDPIIFIYRVYT
jgi:hypothetical protein